MILVNDKRVDPTRFPDNTSQVWHLEDQGIVGPPYRVLWHWEHEGEFVHMLQLLSLITGPSPAEPVHVYVPYLPYARQDHEVSDDATFALDAFTIAFRPYHALWHFLDPHPPEGNRYLKRLQHVRHRPNHEAFVLAEGYDTVLLPDDGASKRYRAMPVTTYIGSKHRDQATGKIRSHTLPSFLPDPSGALPRKILLVDDLCDGGASFLGLAEKVHEQYREAQRPQLDLYVTHGIFSAGLSALLKSYDRIVTTDSYHRILRDPRAVRMAGKQNALFTAFSYAQEEKRLVVLDSLHMLGYEKGQP